MSECRIKAVIVGAGPAGLTAAYELCKQGQSATVLEGDPDYVGGLARTVRYRGCRFDIGGHRFFSKSQEIEDLWKEILGPDLLERPRSSKIYYRGQFYSYPLKPLEALHQLGLEESILCVLSFLRAKARPITNPKSYEEWVINQFGRRLFRIFFKTYTEKVWGMSCSDISADWAAQRIKGLSLGTAIRNAMLSNSVRKGRGKVVKSLADTFRYPRLGPGMMWEKCAEKIKAMGGDVLLGRKVVHSCFKASENRWIVSARTTDGRLQEFRGEHLISSMPIRELVEIVEPAFQKQAKLAGTLLKYRDFLAVGLILRERNRFNDSWIYIHDPQVKVGRIQNYKAWSSEMVSDQNHCCYGMEYFCFEGDGLWNLTDEGVLDMAKKELHALGLAELDDIIDGFVVRQPKAYPVYDASYRQNVKEVRQALQTTVRNIHLVGRNGMHKYNNQDHAMMTGLLAARNILAGYEKYDLWAVNEDANYHEAGAQLFDIQPK